MKRKSSLIFCTVPVLFFTLVFFTGCVSKGPEVNLNYEKYYPDLKFELSDYSGKTLTLLNMTNEAANSTMWGYYSSDGKVAYVTEWPGRISGTCFREPS